MERWFIVLVKGSPIHDGLLDYNEAIELWYRWDFLTTDVVIKEVTDVVQ